MVVYWEELAGVIGRCVREGMVRPDQREECHAEVGARLLELADRFDPERGVPFSAWMRGHMRVRVIDWVREQTREIAVQPLEDAPVQSEDPIDRVIDRGAQRQVLRGALQRLPRSQRTVIGLRFGLSGDREYSRQEVAGMLGCSEQAVAAMQQRALMNMGGHVQAGMQAC